MGMGREVKVLRVTQSLRVRGIRYAGKRPLDGKALGSLKAVWGDRKEQTLFVKSEICLTFSSWLGWISPAPQKKGGGGRGKGDGQGEERFRGEELGGEEREGYAIFGNVVA